MEFKLCVRVREIVGVWRLQEAFASSSPGRRADGPDAGTPCTVCRAFGGFSTRSLAKDKVARVLQSGILSQSRGREFCRDCFSVRSEVVLGARVRRFPLLLGPGQDRANVCFTQSVPKLKLRKLRGRSLDFVLL